MISIIYKRRPVTGLEVFAFDLNTDFPVLLVALFLQIGHIQVPTWSPFYLLALQNLFPPLVLFSRPERPASGLKKDEERFAIFKHSSPCSLVVVAQCNDFQNICFSAILLLLIAHGTCAVPR